MTSEGRIFTLRKDPKSKEIFWWEIPVVTEDLKHHEGIKARTRVS